jgi:hypothetical protein
MKKSILLPLVFALFMGACALQSQTQIGPRQMFVLGEGKHGSYTATLKNVTNRPIDIFETQADGTEKKIATLQANEEKTVFVEANKRVCFRNDSDRMARINIKLVGDKNLSMGYKDAR